MENPEQPLSLSAREKLSLVARILIIFPFSLISFILRNLFVFDRWLFRVRNAASRCLTGSLTVKQLQCFFPSTLDTYKKWVRSKGFAENIEEFLAENSGEASARIMWLGEAWKPGQKLLLYFHGGGYALPLMPCHLDFLGYINTVAEENGLKGTVSIAVLEYTNSPAQRYPFQLRQATQALSRLLSRGIPPSSIVIAGDSAGGHLALSLISHILHPHPDIPPLSLTTPLAGVALISPPTLISNASADSFIRHKDIDILAADTCQHWTALMTENTPFSDELEAGKYWGEPAPAPESWWSGLGNVTRKMLVTAGEEEVLVDDTKVFMKKMEGVQKTEEEGFWFESVIAKGEVHDAPLMDFVINAKKSETTVKSAEFVVKAFDDGYETVM
ncbi:alpha/beta-hydrolase [Wilcoxina mikolae CBS 423.85]|nr:alpha/beta-hydrolase [Wilcoxina mikolae CBS 423.85]